MTYVRSLDGLRGVAVALVMLTHFHGLLQCGWIGVPIFYALSGFLITRILVSTKPGTTLGGYVGGFELRRVFRIFPVYFAYLAMLGAAYLLTGHPTVVRQLLPWAATYTLNFALAFDRLPIYGLYAHFWSLSVEEQFYLVWPFVVWFASARGLRRILVGLVLGGFAFRLAAFLAGASAMQIYLLTPSHVDALAAGAAIAVFDFSAITKPGRVSFALFVVLLAAGALSATFAQVRPEWSSFGYPETMPDNAASVWGYTLIDLFAASLVLACVRGGMTWLESRPLVELGRISYGLYVLHRPWAHALSALEPRFAHVVPSEPVRRVLEFALYVGVSIPLARLSFVHFESRILALRDRVTGALDARTDARAS